MPDVRLERSQPQRLGPVLAVGREHGLRLDRIAEHRSGAMPLHDVHIGRGEPAVGQRLPDHPFLRRAVGRGQPVRRAIRVHRAASDDGEHPVSEPDRIGKPGQHEQSGALTPARAVGGSRERLAPAVRRQATLAGERHEGRGSRQHGHTTRERQLTFAVPQRPGGGVQRDQGGRARGVNGQRGAFESQRVRDPAGQRARRGAGQQVVVTVFRGAQHGAVVVCGRADEDTGPGAAQRVRVDPGPFRGFPRDFEHQPLLGVGRDGLAGGHPEERGVEQRGVRQEAASCPRVDVPAPVGRDSGNGVHSGRDEPPQRLRTVGATGEPTAHPDDRDGLVLATRPHLLLAALVCAGNQLVAQPVCHRGHGRGVEDQGRG